MGSNCLTKPSLMEMVKSVEATSPFRSMPCLTPQRGHSARCPAEGSTVGVGVGCLRDGQGGRWCQAFVPQSEVHEPAVTKGCLMEVWGCPLSTHLGTKHHPFVTAGVKEIHGKFLTSGHPVRPCLKPSRSPSQGVLRERPAQPEDPGTGPL